MIAIYTRVSSKGQEDNYSLPAQLRDGIAFAGKLGEPYKHYQDVASGDDVTRAGVVQLQADLLTEGFTHLWIGALDRLSRSTVEALQILEILKKQNCQLVAGSNHYDVHSPDTEFLLTILWAQGRQEKQNIKRRTGGGRKGEIDAGKRKFCYVYGYKFKFNSEGKKDVLIDEDEAKVVRLIYQRYQAGQSFKDITLHLNESGYKPKKYGWVVKEGKDAGKVLTPAFDQNTISKILHRPEYIGMTHNTRKELIKSIYPAIFTSPEEVDGWYEIQRTIKAKTTARVAKNFREVDNLLSGLLRCANCGAGYFFHKTTRQRGKPANYFTYMHKVQTETQRACKNSPKNLVSFPLELVLLQVYKNLIYNREDFLAFVKTQKSRLLSSIQEIEDAILRLNTDLEGVKKAKKKLLQLYTMGDAFTVEELEPQAKELNSKESAIQANIASRTQELRTLQTTEDEGIRALQHETNNDFQAMTVKQQRALLGIRLDMKIDNGILKITSILGTQFNIEVDHFFEKCKKVSKVVYDKMKDMEEVELLGQPEPGERDDFDFWLREFFGSSYLWEFEAKEKQEVRIVYKGPVPVKADKSS